MQASERIELRISLLIIMMDENSKEVRIDRRVANIGDVSEDLPHSNRYSYCTISLL
jgi:hypothetical protein